MLKMNKKNKRLISPYIVVGPDGAQMPYINIINYDYKMIEELFFSEYEFSKSSTIMNIINT